MSKGQDYVKKRTKIVVSFACAAGMAGASTALAQPASFDKGVDASILEAERAIQELNAASKTRVKEKRPVSQPVAKAAPRPVVRMTGPCNLNGNTQFFQIPYIGFCGAVHGSFTGFLGKDFATEDIAFTTQRLPAYRYGWNGLGLSAAVPMLYYWKNPLVGKTTSGAYTGTYSMVNFLAFRNTDYGTISVFINAGLFARTVKNYEGETRITLNQLYGNYWRGAFDQAWVQWGGLRVGLQPSLFSFSRTGYTFMPGYASYMTTPAVSYTHRIENINVLPGLLPRLGASISVSAEDPTLRRYPDGVLSRYPTGMGYPDFVAQLRVGAPAFVVHASGAMHEIRDVSANAYNTFMPKYSTWGWAAQLAGEYRWKWSGLVGPIGGEMYGKAMLSATATQGALSYLGMPYMSIDYVSSSTGTIQRSSGQSLMASYEHLWTPVFKTSITGAAFQSYMGSAPEFLGFGNAAFGFNTQVRGQRVVGNAEYWAGEGWAFGLEGGWTWSQANGQYLGGRGLPVAVNFPNVLTYMRKAF
ncbi:porin [Methylocystis rosea]|uniref:Porin n=1 Tax=Methylocystis rosea TaxID=173366 RepID=A0A3G8M833_9HYPH|nr:porin [Methylocystis rosea]